jgi:hypothetical protein
MALKRIRLPLTVRALAAFTEEETQRFVQSLVRAEQPSGVEKSCSTEEGSGRKAVAQCRDALAPFARWLFVQTQGQPLYVVEILKELLAREIMVPVPGENGAWGLMLKTGLLAETPVGELIPLSVRELICSQLTRLTSSAWTLLAAGVALGQDMSFERLIGVARLDEQEGLRALEEVLSNGLLREGLQGEEAQGYSFPCEMMREVVSQEVGATRKRLVQQRALLVVREEVADHGAGERRLPSPACGDSYACAEIKHGQARPVHTLPAVRGVWRQAAPDFTRSPPGSPFRALI